MSGYMYNTLRAVVQDGGRGVEKESGDHEEKQCCKLYVLRRNEQPESEEKGCKSMRMSAPLV